MKQYHAAGLDNSWELTKVRDLQGKMREFTRQTGLKRQYPREQVVIGDRDFSLAKQGKLFDLFSRTDESVYSKSLDFSEKYGDD